MLKKESRGGTVSNIPHTPLPPLTAMQKAIVAACDEVKDILLEKNRAYGNSASDPVRIFSKADPLEQINVRIDDKLSRLMRGHEYAGDDTELDLIGYLILKRAIKTVGG